MIPMFIAAALGGGGLAEVPDLSDLSDPLQAIDGFTGSDPRPKVGVRFLASGVIQEASGTTSGMSYSNVGNWMPDTPLDASDWEVRFAVNSETGDPGSWTGSATESFHALSSTRTFEWEKDGVDTGNANSQVTCTLRQVSVPANAATRSSLTYNANIEP